MKNAHTDHEIPWTSVPVSVRVAALRALEQAGGALALPRLPKVRWIRGGHRAGEVEHPAGWIVSNDPDNIYIRADHSPEDVGTVILHECRHAWQVATGNYETRTAEGDATAFTNRLRGKTVFANPRPPEVVIENCAGLQVERGVITGLAEVYRYPFECADHHKIFYPGAFGESLKDSGIRALWGGESGEVLGRNYARTLRITETERGLWVNIAPPDTPLARFVVDGISRRDIDQLRLNVTVLREHWGIDATGQKRRFILEARVNYVSLRYSARFIWR
ncbi:MAG: HK97 family phage prohead protease [Dethiobacteraceae bacterium]